MTTILFFTENKISQCQYMHISTKNEFLRENLKIKSLGWKRMGNPGEKLKTYEHCCYSHFFSFSGGWVGWKYWVYFLKVNINRMKKITEWNKTRNNWWGLGTSGIPPTSWSWPYRIRSPTFNRAKSSHKWMQRINHRNWIFHFILNQYMPGIFKGCFQGHLRKS